MATRSNIAYIGRYMNVKGCNKIEIIDQNDPDIGVQFRNMADGNWPIINGMMRKDRGQILVSGNTLVKVYR